MGDWRNDPDVVKTSGKSTTVHMPRRSIPLINDGEVEELQTPLRYATTPRSLRILANSRGTCGPVVTFGTGSGHESEPFILRHDRREHRLRWPTSCGEGV